jgi:16S rRNA (cytidine1402-2'-O)-methyltransferase
MKSAFYGKLYLIPTTMGDCDPMDVLPQTIKEIDFIDHYIVENDKTARKSIKEVNPEKKQSDLILFTLNKRTESKNILILSNLTRRKKHGTNERSRLPWSC